ncbi:MAG: NYN domain-containing protein [Chloroflexota bacterium]
MRYILVDGYNVIRADPRLQALESVSLERARTVLVQTLASSPRLVGDEIVVVFDGTGGTRTHVHVHRHGRVLMLFSARGQSADDVIVAQAQQLSRRGKVVVVSNDVDVRENSRANGAEVSGSENLLTQMPGRRQRTEGQSDSEDGRERSLSTRKHGNPRRASKRSRRNDVRF